MENGVQFVQQGRRESYLINDTLLEFEHKKFQHALADQLVFEQDDTDEDRRLIVKTLENLGRGDLPKGSRLFQEVMGELSPMTGKNDCGNGRKHRAKSECTVRFQKHILRRNFSVVGNLLS